MIHWSMFKFINVIGIFPSFGFLIRLCLKCLHTGYIGKCNDAWLTVKFRIFFFLIDIKSLFIDFFLKGIPVPFLLLNPSGGRLQGGDATMTTIPNKPQQLRPQKNMLPLNGQRWRNSVPELQTVHWTEKPHSDVDNVDNYQKRVKCWRWTA